MLGARFFGWTESTGICDSGTLLGATFAALFLGIGFLVFCWLGVWRRLGQLRIWCSDLGGFWWWISFAFGMGWPRLPSETGLVLRRRCRWISVIGRFCSLNLAILFSVWLYPLNSHTTTNQHHPSVQRITTLFFVYLAPTSWTNASMSWVPAGKKRSYSARTTLSRQHLPLPSPDWQFEPKARCLSFAFSPETFWA